MSRLASGSEGCRSTLVVGLIDSDIVEELVTYFLGAGTEGFLLFGLPASDCGTSNSQAEKC